MKRHIPPLKSVRVFEAAARLLSFSKAADELHVTHGAISQQIKILEDFYQTPLFIRKNARVSLTDAGKKLLPVTQKILDQLHQTSADILNETKQKTLTISLTSAFASHWLVPRLTEFQKDFPDITIRLAPSAQFGGFQHSEFDIAIRWGKPTDTSLECYKLFDVDAFAACSKSFLSDNPDLCKAENLGSHHLIHDDKGEAWEAWFHKANLPCPTLNKGHFYADSSVALQAAVAGQGVITAGSILAQNDLQTGKLIIPYNVFLPSRNAYYLSYPQENGDAAHIQEFKIWLLGAVEHYQRTKPGLHKYLHKL